MALPELEDVHVVDGGLPSFDLKKDATWADPLEIVGMQAELDVGKQSRLLILESNARE